MTAPVGDVSSAIARGRNGSRRLRAGEKAPSASSRRFSSSSRARNLPTSSNSTWSTMKLSLPVLPKKSIRPRNTNTCPSSGSVVTRRASSANNTASRRLTPSWIEKLKWPAGPRFMPLTSPFKRSAVSGRSSRRISFASSVTVYGRWASSGLSKELRIGSGGGSLNLLDQSAANLGHRLGRFDESRLVDEVALLLAPDGGLDDAAEMVVGHPRAHQVAQRRFHQ